MIGAVAPRAGSERVKPPAAYPLSMWDAVRNALRAEGHWSDVWAFDPGTNPASFIRRGRAFGNSLRQFTHQAKDLGPAMIGKRLEFRVVAATRTVQLRILTFRPAEARNAEKQLFEKILAKGD